MSSEIRLIVDWHGLKQMGWPYSKAQTWRLMEPENSSVLGQSAEWNLQGMG